MARSATALAVLALLHFLPLASGNPVAVAFGQATSTDIPIDGSRMRVDDSTLPRGMRNTFFLSDSDVSLIGLDPSVTGATVTIGRVGLDPVTTLDLPATGWTRPGSGRQTYKFKSRTGPVRGARLIDGRSIRVSARGPGAYALGGVPQGALGVIVTVGETRFCSLFGGVVTRDDGVRFIARLASAPAACPALGAPTTSTTSTTVTPSTTTTTAPCGNGVVDSGETCDVGIAAGQPGACPTSCNDGDSCTIDVLQSPGTCNAACIASPIASCRNGDGCCPLGCTAANDTDCALPPTTSTITTTSSTTSTTACTPNCTDKVCGDDGCGGSCGVCTSPEECASNGTSCVANCHVICNDGFVADDECNDSCAQGGCQGLCDFICSAGGHFGCDTASCTAPNGMCTSPSISTTSTTSSTSSSTSSSSSTTTTSTTSSTTTTTACKISDDCPDTATVCQNGSCVPCIAFGEACEEQPGATPCCRSLGCGDTVPEFCISGSGSCCHD